MKINHILPNTLILFVLSASFATAAIITGDPHRTEAGFFDIHVCNWPDRPPFYLALFGTEQFNEITSIDITTPDNKKVGSLDLKKFTSTKKKNKPERRVFLTQLAIPKNKANGWYTATIHFKNKPSQTAKDYIIHQSLARATNHSPKDEAEEITNPKSLKWNTIPGANFYKVFIKDMWDNEKLIHSSKLLNKNSYEIPKNLLKLGGYYAWRVHARDLNEHVHLGDFNTGSLSKWVEFTIAE